MTFYYPFLFGISGGEILILLLLVLLLFGPKKIPEIARMIGRGMNEVKKVQREINTEIHRYSSEIEKEAKEMQSEINKITEEPGKKETTNPRGKHLADEKPKPISEKVSQQPEGVAGKADDGKPAPTEEKPAEIQNDDKNDLPYPYGQNSNEK